MASFLCCKPSCPSHLMSCHGSCPKLRGQLPILWVSLLIPLNQKQSALQEVDEAVVRRPDGDVEIPVRRPDGDVELRTAGTSFIVPPCAVCGGILKPYVVFFGDQLPKDRSAR